MKVAKFEGEPVYDLSGGTPKIKGWEISMRCDVELAEALMEFVQKKTTRPTLQEWLSKEDT